MKPISRKGGPRPTGDTAGEIAWEIPLNELPSQRWRGHFDSPSEYTSVHHPGAIRIDVRRQTLLGDIPVMSFASAEADIPRWVQLIDKWIAEANAAMVQEEERDQREHQRILEQNRQAADRVRAADTYRDL